MPIYLFILKHTLLLNFILLDPGCLPHHHLRWHTYLRRPTDVHEPLEQLLPQQSTHDGSTRARRVPLAAVHGRSLTMLLLLEQDDVPAQGCLVRQSELYALLFKEGRYVSLLPVFVLSPCRSSSLLAFLC